MNFQMFKLVLEKAEEPEIKLQHPLDHGKSKKEKSVQITEKFTLPIVIIHSNNEYFNPFLINIRTVNSPIYVTM